MGKKESVVVTMGEMMRLSRGRKTLKEQLSD